MFGRGLGGIEQAATDYAAALALAGYDAHTIIDSQATIIPGLAERGVAYTSMSNQGAWDLWAIKKLRRQLHNIDPLACIAHGNRAVTLLKRASGGRFPVIGVMHNYKIHCRGLAHVFYPTEHLHAHVLAGSIAEERTSLMPNMVRVPPALPERPCHIPPVIGCMGRMVAKKGFSVLVDALGLLAGRGTVFNAVLAGDGNERGALEAQVTRLGLGNRVTFTGWATDKEKFFGAVDIFCLPSLHEPFGIVLLETMAMGVPVVAAASEGPSEILTNGADGLLVPPGDAAQLADALRRLLAEPEERLRLGRAAYKTAKTRYDLPVVAEKLGLALRQVRPL